MKKRIEFNYYNNTACNLESNDLPHWGCCCVCKHRLEVLKSCCRNDDEEDHKCICSKSLEFYVCEIGNIFDENRKVNIAGKHGLCECFHPKKSEEEFQEILKNRKLEKELFDTIGDLTCAIF